MKTYTAKFSTETKTRKSERYYSHAWAIFKDAKILQVGFSASLILAQKAVAGYSKKFPKFEIVSLS